MIKNIFFDFGQVLCNFIPYDLTKPYFTDENDIKTVEEVLFDRLYWDKLDEGTITDEQVVEDVFRRLPERLHNGAEKAYYDWIYNMPEIKGMEEIIIRLKNKGINICVLSNISKLFINNHQHISILKHFDKTVFSATCGLVKPHRDIFEYALNKYNFKPSETLFIDDRIDNIKGAEEVGISGYVFDGNVEKLDEFLKSQNL